MQVPHRLRSMCVKKRIQWVMMLANPPGPEGATTPSSDNRRYCRSRQIRSPLANLGMDAGVEDPDAGLSRDGRKGVALSIALGEPRCGIDGLADGVNCRHEGATQEGIVCVVDTAHHLSKHPELCQVTFSSHG
jgi:hypothetical protein